MSDQRHTECSNLAESQKQNENNIYVMMKTTVPSHI